jgi:hydrogenase nickel incorporation protein HypA/HybF
VHELSLAQQIADQVSAAAVESHVEQVVTVRIKVGSLSGVAAESLQTCWEVVRSVSPLQTSQLEIEVVPVSVFCPNCGCVVVPRAAWDLACPDCDQYCDDVRSGRELEIVALEGI